MATKPVDFRRGADSLAALVREQLRHDPFSGTIIASTGSRGTPCRNKCGHCRIAAYPAPLLTMTREPAGFDIASRKK